MKTHSPLVGFNTNVKHKGKVFHIQTEDSGVKHPHIITHLFADGGRILKSLKTGYSEHLEEEDLTETVRAMMKEQHKAMFVALRDGALDSLIEEALNPRLAVPAAPPSAAPSVPATKPATSAAVAAAKAGPTSKAGSPQAPSPSVRPPAEPPANSEAKPGLPVQRQAPSPQPIRRNESVVPPAKPPMKRTGPQDASKPEHPVAPTDTASRYVASRPAAAFAGGAKPKAQVFGQDMISEKSLDEVILGFLAEELGEDLDREDRKR